MSHAMRPTPFEPLLRRVLDEYRERGSILGIPGGLFYRPQESAPYATKIFGSPLATPIGPAAGPHTQLAGNIVSAWLCGGRFIELKTVQIMDELDIPRPCIDAADEGYNVEWSQELRLEESAREYASAWALVHILHRLLGLERRVPLGTVFNMSVGYNLEGIRSSRMQRFMDSLEDASELLDPIRKRLRTRFPRFADVDIPNRIANSVTLSTMHGCPPDEIERIATHLLAERGLHTTVKLNPTLLGKERLAQILHSHLGFVEIEVPDAAFAHDLPYDRARELIASLRRAADRCGRTFGVKLSNTLEVRNHRGVLAGTEMYLSGRPLYPITLDLFLRLRREFPGLPVSYSAGANADNVASLLAAGVCPVTVASDLLKPGGYGRLAQYLERISDAMAAAGAASLAAFAADADRTLERVAAEALFDPRHTKGYVPAELPKVASPLTAFDCIAAPCVEACAVCQDVPEYVGYLEDGDADAALTAILRRNPLPGITGHICTHRCQTRCTRTNVDRAVGIRDLKRFALERGQARLTPAASTGHRVAVIGAGPSGLAAAFHLALAGVAVTVFEAKDRAGGMPALAPAFRLPPNIVTADVARIEALGVEIRTSAPIKAPPSDLLAQGFAAVYVATGFPRDSMPEDVAGIDAEGVYGAVDFLDRVAHERPPALGTSIVVIGGGNTAMDAARTASRLTHHPCTVAYRRTRAEMPADAEEVALLLEEGNVLLELVSPVKVVAERGRVVSVECVRNHLGEPGADGRRRPEPTPGSNLRLSADAVIVATGQRSDRDLLRSWRLETRPDGGVVVHEATGRAAPDAIYAGGDLARGPAIAVAAAADGRRAAEAILAELGIPLRAPADRATPSASRDVEEIRRRRARRDNRQEPSRLPIGRRGGFELVTSGFTEAQASSEASRCLQCATICEKCVQVCPNRANVPYEIEPVDVEVPVVSLADGAVAGHERVSIHQPRQILHIDDLCNECGNCTTFCVHEGKPHAEKPRLFWDRAAFDATGQNALFVDGTALYAKTADGESIRVLLTEDGYAYEDANLTARLTPALAVTEVHSRRRGKGNRSLRAAVEAAALFRALRKSAPFVLPDQEEGAS
ncbi:MAG: putative selenate reductase subunit YgfK [Candidatus Bipolaricaulota bacterium]|nr:putative selenate reductase subunit YgfK [Candidatus Bipolaricaulota bacterium]